ncbi:hypothetical protein MGG_16322 [Pyricularia oryzae 70-15]|uniref:Uncharacterized protein n=2 Tax=Pyricularia oryzae TaxID=318829 RepID=G4MKF3_PYRO7|nr:uncharacterized protein MGG_16322 [Pyricularia oryzae 70-15]EHA57542.1 hypothetical protein MGG_16322 [Pyricularia oryzae 70-15]ELQ37666.1 hypothetical protein OOU_Y34scaffold00585g4 [Pyricularia oryzae Y34]
MNYIRGTTKPFEGAAYVVNHEAKQIARLVAMRWTSIVGYTGDQKKYKKGKRKTNADWRPWWLSPLSPGSWELPTLEAFSHSHDAFENEIKAGSTFKD